MKYYILLFAVLFTLPSMAHELCPVNKAIEPDMRIPESHYSKKNAQLALNKLKGIITKNDQAYEWMTVPNALQTIEGYILKKDASKAEFRLTQFCTFMKSSVWND